jgi:hypothetical protein
MMEEGVQPCLWLRSLRRERQEKRMIEMIDLT